MTPRMKHLVSLVVALGRHDHDSTEGRKRTALLFLEPRSRTYPVTNVFVQDDIAVVPLQRGAWQPNLRASLSIRYPQFRRSPAQCRRRCAGAFGGSASETSCSGVFGDDIPIRKTHGSSWRRPSSSTRRAVTAGDSAADALAEIEPRTPDVRLSDIGMSREDGYQLIRRLRNRPAGNGARFQRSRSQRIDRGSRCRGGRRVPGAHRKGVRAEVLVHLIASLGRSTHSPS